MNESNDPVYTIENNGFITFSIGENIEINTIISKTENKRKCIYYGTILGQGIVFFLYLITILNIGLPLGVRVHTSIILLLIFFLPIFLVLGFMRRYWIDKIMNSVREKVIPVILRSLYDSAQYDYGDVYKIEIGKVGLLAENAIIPPFNTQKISHSLYFSIKNFIEINFNVTNTSRIKNNTGKTYGGRISNQEMNSGIIEIRGMKPRYNLEKSIIITTDAKESSYSKKTHSSGLIGYVLGGNMVSIICNIILFKDQMIPGSLINISVVGKFLAFSALFGIFFGFLGYRLGVWIKKRSIQNETINLENISFENYFDVVSEDEIESRMIVTPAFMERLYNISKRTQKKYSVVFDGNCIFIHWTLPTGFLSVGDIGKNLNNKEFLSLWHQEIKEIFDIIHELNIAYYFLDNTTGELTSQ